MALLEIRWKPTLRELRQFGALLGLFFALLAYWNRESGWPVLACFAAGTITAGLLAGFRPGWLRPVYVAWMCLAFPIGWVVSHLLLAGIFFLVLTPVGWMMKWAGYDPLQRRRQPAQDSYWEPRDSHRDPRQYFRQF